MRPLQILSRLRPIRQDPVKAGLVGSAIRWFLGLSGLYGLYAVMSTLFTLDDDLRVVDQFAMMLGPISTALSLLVAPVTFAATAGNPLQLRRRDPRDVSWYAAKLALFGLGAYGLCAVGPWISSALLSSERYAAPDVVPTSQQILEGARVLVPIAIAAFAVLSGVGGALIGRAAAWWHPKGRAPATWLCWLALFLSFWLPFLLTANLILHGEIPVAWILVAPLLTPALVIAAFALGVFDDLRRTVFSVGRLGKSDSYDPHHLDRVDSAVNPPCEGASERVGGRQDVSRSELEMIHMVKGIRQVVGTETNLSPQRLDEITNVLLDAPASKATMVKRGRSRGDQLWRLSGFCTTWTCLASGMLMVGMLGGTPPNLGLAGFLGLLGSTMVLAATEGLPVLARKRWA